MKLRRVIAVKNEGLGPTFDAKYIRQLNCARVFRAVRELEPISRAELARTTQLSATTISETVAMLLKSGFVLEAEAGGSNGGRPPIMLRVNADRGYVVGVDLDVGRFAIALGDLHLNVVGTNTVELACSDYEFVLQAMANGIRELMGGLEIPLTKLLGVAVGVPGQVRFDEGVLKYAPNLGWSEVPLRDDMERILGVPVHIENDAKLSALGEKWFGAGQHATEIVFVSVKTGLGCGIVIDGTIYRGIDGSAGELGHMTIDASGPRCACGNYGCWETFADENAVIGRALREVTSSRSSEILKRCDGDARRLTIGDIVAAARSGDAAAVRIVKETAWYLGIGITNIVNAFNPELVIVGGHIASAGSLMFDVINSVVRERALGVPKSRVQILPSGLDDRSCVMGCLALVVEEQLEEPKTLAVTMLAEPQCRLDDELVPVSDAHGPDARYVRDGC